MAGRILTFIVLIVMISGLLYVAGITSNNENNSIKMIFQLINGGGSISNTDLYLKIAIAITAIVGAAAVSAFTFGNANAGTVVGSSLMTGILLSFISDFFFILRKAGESGQGWVYWIIAIIFIPIIFGFGWSIFDFIRGQE